MIHQYPSDITFNLPEAFTDPFRYSPHPLVLQAAELLMHDIGSSPELSAIFAEGKMLGVLAVAYGESYVNVGYLAAFSGNVGNRSMIEGFVPPIFDLMDPDGYFKGKEAEISRINDEIACIEKSSDLIRLQEHLNEAKNSLVSETEAQKARMAIMKAERDSMRKNGTNAEQANTLIRQSQHEKAELRRIKAYWDVRIADISAQIATYTEQITSLKRLRKEMSDTLQEWIFRQYQVQNYKGEIHSILDIFSENGLVPPGGTGECAAPKLLNYAFRKNLKPLAMGEFWYGKSPATAVRTQGHFYPSCTSKCGPLLGHMLNGMNLLKENSIHGEPFIKYEDDDIIVGYKPSGMPSVPGLTGGTSMLDWLVSATGCTEIESVHRLDMDTSGVMIFAKHQKAGNNIRRQFEQHSIKKTYKARLSGSGNNLHPGDRGIISIPLSPDYDERPRQKADFCHGKETITEYQIEKTLDDGSIMVIFWPKTGRTHQLRVHSAHRLGLGHPIMGDMLYGGVGASRLYLHAEEIRFIHPTISQEVTFTIPW